MSRKSTFTSRSRAAQLNIDDKRVVFYIRASTPEQVNSLDAQKLAGQRWADARGIQIVRFFVDAGVSAVKHAMTDRPQAKAMFRFMKEQQIARAAFIRPIRAFRSTRDLCNTTSWMQENGIIFSFIDPEIDSNTIAGRLMLQLLVSVGEMECETRAAAQVETYDSLRERRIARSTQEPYGWRLGPVSTSIARSSRKPLHTLIPLPAEQAVLRHIKQLWDAPGKPFGKLTAIAALLNSHRIPTKTPAGTILQRTYAKGTPKERTLTITTDGTWKPMTVKSVLAHAVLATDAELPDGLPSFDQAAALLRNEDTPVLTTVAGTTSPSPSQGQPVPAIFSDF